MATAPPRTDAGLLERLRRRDRTAWDELYRTYEGRLYGFAYRLTGNPHDAADLVQETFVRALPKLDSLPPERADIGAYLFATTKNLFLKQVERGKRTQPVDEVPEPEEPTHIEDDPQRAALLARQQLEVRLANAKLAPRQRMVLALRELEDRSYAEIGEIVGLNENAVAQLISRARQSLRDELRLVQVDRSKLPRACQARLPALSALLDDQLKGAARDETVAHVEGCSFCQAVLSDMREASRRYRAIVPPVVVGIALKQGIDDGLAATGYWEQSRRALRLGGLAVRGKAAVLIGVAGLALLGAAGGGAAYLVARDGGERRPAAAAIGTDTAGPAGPVASETGPVEPATSDVGATDPATTVTVTPAVTTAPVTTGETSALGTGQDTADPPVVDSPATTQQPGTAAEPTTSEPPPSTTDKQPPPPTTAADTKAPTVTIGAGPTDPTSDTSASFSFSANEQATFRCALDGGAFAPCSSPAQHAGLALGTHTFAVYALDQAGNQSSTRSTSWTIEPPPDTEPPAVTITGTPKSPTTATAATFRFQASEPAVFQCQLDGGGFAPCASPAQYAGLAPGSHTFAVRATDAAGNTGEPRSFTWVIQAPGQPDLVIASLMKNAVIVANVGNATAGPSTLRLPTVGSFSVPALAPGASAAFAFACRPGTLVAVADAGSQVGESNEGNNTLTIVVTRC